MSPDRLAPPPAPSPAPSSIAARRLTPTQRTRLTRVGAYVLALLAVVAVALVVDWPRVQESFLDPDQIANLFPDIVTIGARNTLLYTVFSFVGGLALGLVMALCRLSAIGPFRWFAAGFIEVFRGLPALLTIFTVGFILPIATGVSIPEVFGLTGAGILALSLVAGAYLAETIRAGIEAVPRGQMEAARSLGMPYGRAMVSIVIPQAFRIIIPPLTNEVILLLKDTSLLAVLGTTPLTKELTKLGRDEAASSFNGTPLVMAGLLYLVITIPLTRLVAQLEKRNQRSR